MSKQVSILFTLKDNFTNSLKKISSEQGRFKKDLYNTSKQLQELYDKKRNLQIDNRAANKAIKDTAKNAEKLGKDLQSVMKQNVAKKVSSQFGLDEVNRKIKEVEKNLNRTGKTKVRPEVSVKDNASGVLNGISSKLKGLGKGVALGVTGLAAGAVAAAGAGAGYALKLAGENEQASVAFETMLGSKNKSDKLLAEMKQFAIATPFEYDQLRDSAKKMLAYGFKDTDIMPMMTGVGNAASGLGLGSDGVDRITIALGQMRAKAKVSGDEMRQLTEAGIPAWEMLSEATGLTTAQLMKLSEKGAIPANKAIQALIKGMNKRFPNMMEKQSRTLFGLWSSLKDFAKLNIFSAFGEGIRQGILPTFQKFIDGITKNKKGLEDIQKKLIDVGHTIGDWVSKKAEGLYEWFQKLFNNPEFQKADLGGKAGMILDSLYDGFNKWYNGDGGSKLSSFFEGVGSGIVGILTVALDKAVPQFVDIGLKLGKGILEGIGKGIAGSNPTVEVSPGKTVEIPQDPIFGTLSGFTDKMFGNSENDILRFLFRDPSRHKNAFGISRVPYDNFPTLLHEGEKVLTKQESNNSTRSFILQKLADTIVIREEADIDRLIDKLAQMLKDTSNNSGGGFAWNSG